MTKVKFPFGAADNVSKDYAATVAITVDNTKTIATIGQATGACTVNLTIDENMEDGAELILKTSADGTNRVFTWGTGMTGNAYTNNASKSAAHRFVYDGSSFIHLGSTQLN